MECRRGCGACCIAPSINHPLPNMPNGKPAGVPCVNLDLNTFTCKIWGTDIYPDTCKKFTAEYDICGDSREEALEIIATIEIQTLPQEQKE